LLCLWAMVLELRFQTKGIFIVGDKMTLVNLVQEISKLERLLRSCYLLITNSLLKLNAVSILRFL
jgi:hypothetical protein